MSTTTTTSYEEPRMEIGRAAPPLHRALVTLGNEVELDPRLRELVNLRASILNGCAYCIDKHSKIARKAGESEQRLYAVAAWHDASFFDDKEASAHFEPDELAQLVWAITVINAWNRIAITTRMLPAA